MKLSVSSLNSFPLLKLGENLNVDHHNVSPIDSLLPCCLLNVASVEGKFGSDTELIPTSITKKTYNSNCSLTEDRQEQQNEDEDRLEIVAQVEYKNKSMDLSTISVGAMEREVAVDILPNDWNITSFDIFINDELSINMKQVSQGNGSCQRGLEDLDMATDDFNRIDQITEQNAVSTVETISNKSERRASDEITERQSEVKKGESIPVTDQCEVDIVQDSGRDNLQYKYRKYRIREYHIRQRSDRRKCTTFQSSGNANKSLSVSGEDTNSDILLPQRRKELNPSSLNKLSIICLDEEVALDPVANLENASNLDLTASMQWPEAKKCLPDLQLEVESSDIVENHAPCASPTRSMASFGSPNHLSNSSLTQSPIPNYVRFRFPSRVCSDRAHYNSVSINDAQVEGKADPSFDELKTGETAKEKSTPSCIHTLEELETPILAMNMKKDITGKVIGSKPTWPRVPTSNGSSPLCKEVECVGEEVEHFFPCSSSSPCVTPTMMSSIKAHSPIPKYTRLRTFSRMSYDRAYYSENSEEA